jgi:hypothetical protein
MSDIPRWHVSPDAPEGYIWHADHIAAMDANYERGFDNGAKITATAAALSLDGHIARWREELRESNTCSYSQGQRDMLARCIERVMKAYHDEWEREQVSPDAVDLVRWLNELRDSDGWTSDE